MASNDTVAGAGPPPGERVNAATGAPPTEIVIVADVEVSVPSLVVKVNESGPAYPAVGVYVMLGTVPLSVP